LQLRGITADASAPSLHQHRSAKWSQRDTILTLGGNLIALSSQVLGPDLLRSYQIFAAALELQSLAR
jgi:hypothetical protein